MNARIDFQTIVGKDGKPQFVVVPYATFNKLVKQQAVDSESIPNEVVGAVLTKGHSVVRAWREHLGMTQAQLAKKMQLTQAAVAQFEVPGAKLRKASRDKISKAMGISSELLDW
jgi:ribosome-binding protein aMBF1 (putative translation factor)